MRFTNAAKHTMLDALDESQAAGAKFGSLHTAYSTTGANELTGGSPAYTRESLTWNPGGGPTQTENPGQKITSAQAVFDVPPSTTVRWVGLWTALTAGTFLGMTPNGGVAPQAFVVPNITTDVLECVVHGFLAGDTVVVWAVPSDPLPAPLAEGTVYYVISVTDVDHLQLSATEGGAAINITTIGAGNLQKIVPEIFNAQGTHTVTSVTITLD